jgi:hypothetical protein
MPLYNPAGATVTDATIATTDVTTNNASTSKHGWLKKLDNSATNFMNGQGAWAAPSGSGAPMTLTEALLGADVTMVTADTFYDGPTITPSAGTYDVWARVTVAAVATAQQYIVGRLIANASATPIDEAYFQMAWVSTSTGFLTLAARVTADGTNPILIRATGSNANMVMKRDPGADSSGIHRATLLRLTQIA